MNRKSLLSIVLLLVLAVPSMACPMDFVDSGHYVQIQVIDSNTIPVANTSVVAVPQCDSNS